MSLTFRQISVLEERYWDRKQWEIELQNLMNPFGGGEKEELGDGDDELRQIFEQKAIDATNDAGIDYLTKELNIKVKTRTPR